MAAGARETTTARRGKGSGLLAATSDHSGPAAPVAPFRLVALGRFQLEGPRGPVDLGSKKLCALLTFVALAAPQPQSREALTTLLWGSHFEAQARQNLRQALSRLRRALGDGILQSDDDTVSMRRGAISCDAERFEALIRDGGPEALKAAVDLYQGTFLTNISIPEETWQEWVEGQRHRLEELAVNALVRLGQVEADQGSPARALEMATRAVAIDGLREDAHRLIITSLASVGRRAEAFKHYDQLAARLKRELNVEPDATTTALIAGLRKPASAQPASAPVAPRNLAVEPGGADERPVPPSTVSLGEPRSDTGPERDMNAEVQPRDDGRKSASHASAERRQISVLFCDLVGSTALSLRLDPEQYASVIRRYRQAATEAITTLGGHVATFLGDGVMAFFGWPVSHEDDAERALRVGLRLIDVIAGVPSVAGERLMARVGVSTGLVVIGGDNADTGDGGIAGLTPNLAGRLQAEAEPGMVVVTAMTARLAGKAFEYRSLGQRAVKGLDEKLEILQVVGATPASSRFEAQRARSDAPLIGRNEELDLLLSRWRRACGGEGQIVLLSGDAGIGKSRLVHTLYERVRPDAIVLRYQCSPLHRDDALYPIMQRVLRTAKITNNDSPTDKLAKLEAIHRRMGVEPAEHLPVMCHLLQIESKTHRLPDVGPQQLRELLVASLWTQVRSLAKSGPILSIVEDAQWIDPTSEALLLRTLGEIEHLPMMVVVTNRDSYPSSWRSQDYTTLLGLERLSTSDSRRLIQAIAGDCLADSVQATIATRAGGVPLFLEELTLSLLERGTTGAGDDPGDVPVSLQALLATRLEKMGKAKRLVQVGAVLGRQFAATDVQAVSGCSEFELEAMLDQALTSGLLQRQKFGADATLVFKHALVHDAAYAGLLNSEKKRLHRAVLQLMETRTGVVQGGGAAVLALHAERGEVWDKAAQYLIASCKHAIRASANHEAVALFERTLRVLEHLPPEIAAPLAIDIRLYAFSPLLALGETDRQVQILREAETLADGLDDKRRMAATASLLANALWLAGDHRAGLRSVEKAERLAKELDDFVLRLSTRFNHANLFHATGRVREAADLYAAIAADLRGELELKRFGWPGPPSVLARSMLSWSLVWLGDFPRALECAMQADKVAHQLGDLYSIVYAQMAKGLYHAGLGESADAIVAFEAAHAANREADMVLPVALAWLGAAYAQGGRAAEALPLLLDAERSGTYKAGGKYNWIHHYMALAQTHLALRELDAARVAVCHAQDIADATGELAHLAWSLKLRGDIEAAGHAAALPLARDAYQRALALAEPRGLRPLAAHCLAGLAATYMKENQPKAAAAHRGKADAIFEALGMTHWLEVQAGARKRAG